MKLPNGTLIKLRERILAIEPESKISIPNLSEYISTVRRPTRKRAYLLKEASGVSPELWLFGNAEQIRAKLKNLGG